MFLPIKENSCFSTATWTTDWPQLSGSAAECRPEILMLLKCFDLVDFKTMQMMNKVQNDLLSNFIRRRFKTRAGQYELPGLGMSGKPRRRTNVKSRCVSVKAVNLRVGCDAELKMCRSFALFKRMFASKVDINRCKPQEWWACFWKCRNLEYFLCINLLVLHLL